MSGLREKGAATAGPWELSQARGSEGEYLVVAGEGHGFGLVAAVTTEADANQIVALPDLKAACLEALELARVAEGLTGCRGDDEWVWGIQEKIVAALTKAGVALSSPLSHGGRHG